MKNNVYLIGRLTKDIEVRTNESGSKFGSFSLAVTRDYKNENGEYDADFINCKTFSHTAEYLGKYTGKGDLIIVKGRIQNRSYEQDGEKKYITEVVVDRAAILVTKNKTEASEENKEKSGSIDQEEIIITDDDLPF